MSTRNEEALLEAAERGALADVIACLNKGANVNCAKKIGLTPLHQSIDSGLLDVVCHLLDNGANLEARDSAGWTPLFKASSWGRGHIVRILLEKGANVQACDATGSTPLHKAAISGRLDVARLLSEHGANVEARDLSGATPLFRAAENDRPALVRFLLEHGANVDAYDEIGSSPLHKAAFRGYMDVVRLLLDKGALVDARDSIGSTPLHQAALKGQMDVVRLLLEHGAALDALDSSANTLLHYAAQGNQRSIASLLLEKGANIDARNNPASSKDDVASLLRSHPRVLNQLFNAMHSQRFDEATRVLTSNLVYANVRNCFETLLLHLVVATQHLPLLQALLQKPGLQLDAKDAAGRSALAIVIRTDNVQAALALHQAGASVDLVDKDHCASSAIFATALHQAAASNDGTSLSQLLALGVNCSSTNENGETAMFMAAAAGHLPIVTMLLQMTEEESGIDATNHNGESPLFAAAIGGHADVVQCLLRANANPRLVSKDGSTMLHAAALGGSMSILHQIVQCGVSVDACDAMGQTPLHVAAEKAHDSAVKYLLDVEASVFAKDTTGKTPLMLATHPLVINTLLQAEKSTKQKVPQLSELNHLITRICDSESMVGGLLDRVRPTPSMSSAASTDSVTWSPSSVSTHVVCQLCHASNSLLESHCEACVEPLASVASKLQVLLKRLAAAKKNGFEIDDGLVCVCCDAHHSMTATICDECADELPNDNEKLRILVLRIEQKTMAQAS
ncbi:hypothetical protein SDRG_11778 [Saprolegnia diclina VS20]|uniref:Uncharacterized protein n=1 Tax=Saprolegnia diclina (strain VS20) TaxID=1156394 RepID=T0RDY1_SAPDV|nr:hypothetical protein SDRG_11778 [Saprolegnia diclina VS20]EQC30458.1 hypothetical protein SDRG_11778 [Saprolegnia diclina VS20]|eukprot:XP_008616051.1 hypothetical protein SDRG_11778 [Saprolegnia diclina VS20]